MVGEEEAGDVRHMGFTEAKGDACSQVSNSQLPLSGQELKRCHYICQLEGPPMARQAPLYR